MAAKQDLSFKGRRFTSEVILCALPWYLSFPISYRDLAAILLDRGMLTARPPRARKQRRDFRVRRTRDRLPSANALRPDQLQRE
jgi:hypothetical protein